MTPLKLILATFEAIISANKIHMQNMGLMMTKIESRKSRATVPLK
jgi:hypothetical protein